MNHARAPWPVNFAASRAAWRQRRIKSLLAVLSSIVAFAVSALARHNLLIITADDMNGDSWFNSPVHATPRLDAFAATCYRFEQCHVAAPICQPSREALMTGRVPHRSGALGFNPIHLEVPTLTEVMSSNGYFTAAMNKLAHMAPRQKFNWDLSFDGSGKNPTILRDQFAQCLKTAATANKPFFINVNITDPHRPFAGSNQPDAEEQAEKKKRSVSVNQANAAPVKMFSPAQIVVPSFLEDIPNLRKEVAQYFSSVRRLDESFAGLLAALKDSGQETNTVIVFMSDHGMSFPFAKATIFRNGTWSPLLFKWPGMGKPFVNATDMVNSIDIMPTLLDLLEISKPPGMDGRSFFPLLHGERQEGRDHVFTYVNTVSSGKAFPGRCIRTKSRAYIWNSWPDGKTQFRVEAMSGLSFKAMAEAAARDPKIKERVEHYLFRTPEEFYDNGKDPDERRNLIDDPDSQAEIKRMKAMLLEQMKRTSDPLLEKFQSGAKGGAENVISRIGVDDASGTCAAVVVNDVPLVHTSQLLPQGSDGRFVGEGDAAAQAERVLANLETVLKAAGSKLADTVKINIYLAGLEAKKDVERMLAQKLPGAAKPAVSFVVGTLAVPGALVAMDGIAVAQSEGLATRRITVPEFQATPGIAQAAILPSGPKIFLSGMADTNALPEATRKTLAKLVAALDQLGATKDDIVQLKAFLQPMSELSQVQKEIVSFFGGAAPPTVFVEWISPPPNPPIEIELVAAATRDASNEADSISFLTPAGTTSTKVYSRVARVNHGNLIYVSGLYGIGATNGAAQVREIFRSLGDLLKRSGSDFEHLAKATYYVSDEEASRSLNDIRPEFYNPQRPPAASKAKVKGVGAAGRTVSMDMIAVPGK